MTLKKGAVPSIFPNCPSYLSKSNSNPKRLSKDDKERLRMEAIHNQSIVDNEEITDKFLVDSFSELLSKLHLIDFRNGWISHHSENNPLYFLKIDISDSGPIINRSISIDHDLFIKHSTLTLFRFAFRGFQLLTPAKLKVHFMRSITFPHQLIVNARTLNLQLKIMSN